MAGDIFLNANHISISNDSAISSSAYNIGTAGSITIKTQDLDLSYNSKIVTSGLLSNDAGSISISADKINLSSSNISSSIFSDFTEIGVNIVIVNPSLYTSSTISSNSGFGGNISIETKQLLLKNSTISTSSQGFGRGGNIDIKSQSIVGDSSSSITASSVSSFGGNISVKSEGAVFAKGFSLSASSALGSKFNGSVDVESTSSSPVATTPASVSPLPIENLISCEESTPLSYLGAGGTPMVLSDSVSLSDFQKAEPIQTSLFITDQDTGEKIPLIEPAGWTNNPDGTIRFVANKADAIQYATQYPPCKLAQTAP